MDFQNSRGLLRISEHSNDFFVQPNFLDKLFLHVKLFLRKIYIVVGTEVVFCGTVKLESIFRQLPLNYLDV